MVAFNGTRLSTEGMCMARYIRKPVRLLFEVFILILTDSMVVEYVLNAAKDEVINR